MADDDLTFDFEHQLDEVPEPLAALPVSFHDSSCQDRARPPRMLQ
jgi:hypothetical protein